MPNTRRVSTAGAYAVFDNNGPRVSTAGVYVVHGPNERRISTAGVYVVEVDGGAEPGTAPTVSIDQSSPLEITKGYTDELTVTVTGDPEPTLTWESSDDEIVGVDAAGNLYAFAEGIATITVTASNGVEPDDTDSIIVNVTDSPPDPGPDNPDYEDFAPLWDDERTKWGPAPGAGTGMPGLPGIAMRGGIHDPGFFALIEAGSGKAFRAKGRVLISGRNRWAGHSYYWGQRSVTAGVGVSGYGYGRDGEEPTWFGFFAGIRVDSPAQHNGNGQIKGAGPGRLFVGFLDPSRQPTEKGWAAQQVALRYMPRMYAYSDRAMADYIDGLGGAQWWLPDGPPKSTCPTCGGSTIPTEKWYEVELEVSQRSPGEARVRARINGADGVDIPHPDVDGWHIDTIWGTARGQASVPAVNLDCAWAGYAGQSTYDVAAFQDGYAVLRGLEVTVTDPGDCGLPPLPPAEPEPWVEPEIVAVDTELATDGGPCDPLVAIHWDPTLPGGEAVTLDLYYSTEEDPETWILIAEGVDASARSYGWGYDAPGSYRFRAIFKDADGVELSVGESLPIALGRPRMLTPEKAAILGGRQMAARTWLFIEDGDGRMQDRSDFLTGYEVRYNRESAVGNASVRLRREHGELSLAPHLDTSPLNQSAFGGYVPAVDIGRRFTIWVAQTTPEDPLLEHRELLFLERAELLFCGRIDEHDFSSSDASLSGRDIYGRLLDTQIEEVRTYGAPDPGEPMQEVVAQILEDNAPGTPLYVPVDIDVQFGLYEQERGLLFEQARLRGLQGGADLRPLFREDNGAYVPWLYQPPEELPAPHYVFQADEWLAVTQLRVAVANIRNAVGGSFLNDAGERIPMPTLVDPASSDPRRYGRRFMEFELGGDSPVRTAEAFETLQRAALQGLSEPDAELEIRTVFFWPASLNKTYGFAPDGLRWSTEKVLACVGYRHVYNRGQGTLSDTWETYLTTRGKLAAGSAEYIQEARPPGASRPPTEPPPAGTPRLTAASFELLSGGSCGSDLPVTVAVSWGAAGLEPGMTVSIYRITDGAINLVASDVGATLGTYEDSLSGYMANRNFERSGGDISELSYQIRLMPAPPDAPRRDFVRSTARQMVNLSACSA